MVRRSAFWLLPLAQPRRVARPMPMFVHPTARLTARLSALASRRVPPPSMTRLLNAAAPEPCRARSSTICAEAATGSPSTGHARPCPPHTVEQHADGRRHRASRLSRGNLADPRSGWRWANSFVRSSALTDTTRTPVGAGAARAVFSPAALGVVTRAGGPLDITDERDWPASASGI